MPRVEFTEDFDWYFESGCCGFAVRAYKAGFAGDVEDDVAVAAVAAGKALLIELQDDGETPEI